MLNWTVNSNTVDSNFHVILTFQHKLKSTYHTAKVRTKPAKYALRKLQFENIHGTLHNCLFCIFSKNVYKYKDSPLLFSSVFKL